MHIFQIHTYYKPCVRDAKMDLQLAECISDNIWVDKNIYYILNSFSSASVEAVLQFSASTEPDSDYHMEGSYRRQLSLTLVPACSATLP